MSSKKLFELIINELKSPKNTFEGKDLLASKLEWSSSFADAYLELLEKKEINRILQKHKQPFRLQI